MFGLFEKLIDPFPPQSPDRPPTGIYAFCRHYTRGMEPWLALMAFLTAVTAVAEALLFGILGQLVDWLASSAPETFIEDTWEPLAAMSIFILVLIPATTGLRSLVVHQTLMGNFPMSVRWMAHRYLLSQSYGFFQNEFSGRIATKVMQTALAVRDTVMKLLDVLLFVVIYLVTALILVANADLRLCVPLVVWLCLYIAVQYYFVPKMKTIAMHQADARSLMTGRIVDSYANILTLKLFSNDGRESAYVKQGMGDFLATVHPQMRLASLLNISLWTLNVGLIFSTSALGIWLWLQDAVTPGSIAVVISLAIRLTGMSHWIMWEISNLFENLGVVQDGINSLSVEQAVGDVEGAPPLQVSRGAIDYRQVSFAYHGGLTDGRARYLPISTCRSLRVKKSVLSDAAAPESLPCQFTCCAFLIFNSGTISIDEQAISDIQQESLRANIAMVTQDTSLLHRSVRENIMFGRPDASEAQVVSAAELAQAHEFILTLQDNQGRRGYDAHVGERGVTLSGGQRQRIAIARVLLKDAPILVLDEATSALDSEVEATIQQSLYQLMQGKTVIAIAHRLSTIAAMDRLIVFDKGEIVEQGTHQELIQQNGVYTKLWGHQSGGFLGFE